MQTNALEAGNSGQDPQSERGPNAVQENEKDRIAKLISDAGAINIQQHMVSSTDEGLINIDAPTECYEEPEEVRV